MEMIQGTELIGTAECEPARCIVRNIGRLGDHPPQRRRIHPIQDHPHPRTQKREPLFGGSGMSAFEELGVAPELVAAAEALGWPLPRPVQAEVVPLILGCGDVLAAAETGEGKTAAFALPLVHLCVEARRRPAHPSVAPAGSPGAGSDADAAAAAVAA